MLKRGVIFIHRWLGVALCLVFLLWFPSGIAMMYWGYPSVSDADRLERSPALDGSTIQLTPAEAYAKLDASGAPGQVRLNIFDGRPVYRFQSGSANGIVFADTGEVLDEIPMAMVERIASAWTSEPANTARIDAITDVDQWTLQIPIANLEPLWKFTWPSGDQVYVSQASGEVEQFTTTASRLAAYAGPITHWFYFTPLRKHGARWGRVVVWSSGIATAVAVLGIVVGLWMFSPRQRYRYEGAPARIPYRGQKRWHMVLGLLFGIATVTWAFSGMLSMEPFPLSGANESNDPRAEIADRIHQALQTRMDFADFQTKPPRAALEQLGDLPVKELELTSMAGQTVYLATVGRDETRIVPVSRVAADDAPRRALDHQSLIDVVRIAAGRDGLSDVRVLDRYDAYYLDRRRERPLPVILARIDDGDRTRLYIDPATARVVEEYRDSDWMLRWAYHALHSLDFPWLYNYRPLWDIVVISFMLGGTALCVTSLILAWRVLLGLRRPALGRGNSSTA
jgi:hypothetical protein